MNRLIVTIVPHGFGEMVAKAARQAGAGGGTLVMARGTATNKIIQLLGLGDTSKDIVFLVVDEAQKDGIISAVKAAASKKKPHFGVLISTDILYFTHAEACGEQKMGEHTHQLIAVIANKGYGDDIMEAARQAGAGGGTIMAARGTAKPGDEKFLGLEIVPEKELLYIIAENSKISGIIEKISSLDCLARPGSGIVFSVPAGDFTLLGKQTGAA